MTVEQEEAVNCKGGVFGTGINTVLRKKASLGQRKVIMCKKTSSEQEET
jgi:hypothetical protein